MPLPKMSRYDDGTPDVAMETLSPAAIVKLLHVPAASSVTLEPAGIEQSLPGCGNLPSDQFCGTLQLPVPPSQLSVCAEELGASAKQSRATIRKVSGGMNTVREQEGEKEHACIRHPRAECPE